MYQQQKITFRRLKEQAIQHPILLILCLMACILLELFFISHPPRGVVATNVIVLGSIQGKPFVGFEALWLRCFNDDNYMLKIIDKLQLKELKTPEMKLNFLNGLVRPNLTYLKFGTTIIKIRFKQPVYDLVRPFLNCFTESIITMLNKITTEEIKDLTKQRKLILNQLVQKGFLLGQLFGAEDFLKDITEKGIIENNYSIASNSHMLTNIGKILINNLRSKIFKAYRDLQNCISTNNTTQNIFPRNAILLTHKHTPPHPVQPYIKLLYFMIPIAMLLIAFAGLLLFDNKKSCQTNP